MQRFHDRFRLLMKPRASLCKAPLTYGAGPSLVIQQRMHCVSQTSSLISERDSPLQQNVRKHCRLNRLEQPRVNDRPGSRTGSSGKPPESYGIIQWIADGLGGQPVEKTNSPGSFRRHTKPNGTSPDEAPVMIGGQAFCSGVAVPRVS